MSKRIDVKNLNIFYGDFHAVKDVSMTIEPRSVTAFIGLMRFLALRWIFRPEPDPATS